jgi:site-specific DNA recombinase
MSGTCSNTRTIARETLEARVLAGLGEKLMAPQVAAEAMRAYQEETNRLNREHRQSGGQDRRALEKAEKAIKEIVAAIEDGGYRRALSDRLGDLERERDALKERLTRAPQELPDLHPAIAEIYRRKVSRLAEALTDPDAHHEAGEDVRGLVERVTLTPGGKRGEMRATLHGDLATIVEWTGPGPAKTRPTPLAQECRSQWLRGEDLNL